MTFAEAQALAEYPNPEVYFSAVYERRRRERIDYMIDTAQAVRAAGAKTEDYKNWIHGLRAERNKAQDEESRTVFDMIKGERRDTVFDRMRRG